MKLEGQEAIERETALRDQIYELRQKVVQLEHLASKQRDEIQSLNDMADAVERLREIGRATGCDHVDDLDGRRQLVNCVEQVIGQEQHQAEVYREQMIKAHADCEANKQAATYWWTRYYKSNGFERPKAFDSATEEFAASHESLINERDSLKASLQAVDKEWSNLKAAVKRAGWKQMTLGGELHILPVDICERCNGTGKFQEPTGTASSEGGEDWRAVDCEQCGGTGRVR